MWQIHQILLGALLMIFADFSDNLDLKILRKYFLGFVNFNKAQ